MSEKIKLTIQEIVCDFEKVAESAKMALHGIQIQPIIN